MRAMSDSMKFEGGILTVEVIRDGKNGPEVIQRRVAHNLILNVGKKKTWQQATGLDSHFFRYMRIGTCGTAPTSGGTNLLSVVASTLTSVDSKTLSPGRTMTFVKSYPSGSGKISATGIKELIVCNSKTTPGRCALCRATFTSVNKTTSDKLKLTYQCRIS